MPKRWDNPNTTVDCPWVSACTIVGRIYHRLFPTCEQKYYLFIKGDISPTKGGYITDQGGDISPTKGGYITDQGGGYITDQISKKVYENQCVENSSLARRARD
jgi:hypothetical protein